MRCENRLHRKRKTCGSWLTIYLSLFLIIPSSGVLGTSNVAQSEQVKSEGNNVTGEMLPANNLTGRNYHKQSFIQTGPGNACANKQNDPVTSRCGNTPDTSDQRYGETDQILSQGYLVSDAEPLFMPETSTLWPEALNINDEKPTNHIADPGCGDKKCEEGDEYACPANCRNVKRTLFHIMFLTAALLLNTGLWKWHARKRSLGRVLNALFAFINLTIAGLMGLIIIRYVCASPYACKHFVKALALMGAGTALFVLVFRGAKIFEWVRKHLALHMGDEQLPGSYKKKKGKQIR